MAEKHEFGLLTHISAESIGQPGQRQFRLLAINEEGETASLWLEKQQLSALGDALEKVLQDEKYEFEPIPPDDLRAEPTFPISPTLEMDIRAGRLLLGVNREVQRIVLISSESPDADDPEAQMLSAEFDYRLGSILQQRAADAVAGGRPPCPVCHAPIDPEGHICSRLNGHHKR